VEVVAEVDFEVDVVATEVEEAAAVLEAVEEEDSKISVLQKQLLNWDISLIRAKISWCANVRPRKYLTSTQQFFWRINSKLGKSTKFLAP